MYVCVCMCVSVYIYVRMHAERFMISAQKSTSKGSFGLFYVYL